MKELMIALLALTIAVGVVIVIENVISSHTMGEPHSSTEPHTPPIQPEKDRIFAMEMMVFLLLVATFTSGKIFHWFDNIRRFMRSEPLHPIDLELKHILLLLGSFAGSLLIYIGMRKLLDII
jgi:hypothetical protein